MKGLETLSFRNKINWIISIHVLNKFLDETRVNQFFSDENREQKRRKKKSIPREGTPVGPHVMNVISYHVKTTLLHFTDQTVSAV